MGNVNGILIIHKLEVSTHVYGVPDGKFLLQFQLYFILLEVILLSAFSLKFKRHINFFNIVQDIVNSSIILFTLCSVHKQILPTLPQESFYSQKSFEDYTRVAETRCTRKEVKHENGIVSEILASLKRSIYLTKFRIFSNKSKFINPINLII